MSTAQSNASSAAMSASSLAKSTLRELCIVALLSYCLLSLLLQSNVFASVVPLILHPLNLMGLVALTTMIVFIILTIVAVIFRLVWPSSRGLGDDEEMGEKMGQHTPEQRALLPHDEKTPLSVSTC